MTRASSAARGRWWRWMVVPLLWACGGGDSTAPDVAPTVTISSAAGATVMSGATLSLSASATNRRGAAVSNPVVTWTSSASTIASVSSIGVVTGATVGTATISAAYDGATATFAVTVTPGVPARLAVRTQPQGAASGIAFTTQPVVEIRDAAGNLVPSAPVSVSAVVVGGGAAVVGASSASATQGVATFTALAITGSIGTYALQFTATGLSPVTSNTFPLTAGAPARLAMRTQPGGAASGAPLSIQPVVEIRDAADNLVSSSTTTVSVVIASGGGILSGATSATAVEGVASFSTLRLDGLVGDRTLRFSASGLSVVTSAAFALQAGAPSSLSLRTAPIGGGLNGPFTTPPVIDVRDAAGNLSASTTLTLTATITTGTGVLTGASATAFNGVATFTGFGVNGGAGPRTIGVTAPGVSALAFDINPCDLQRGPQVGLARTSSALDGFGPTMVFDTILVQELAGSCQAITGVGTSITYASAAGWLSASVLTAPTRLVLRADPAAVVVGTHQATVTVTTSNAGAVPMTVTLESRPVGSLTYGEANEKIRQVDPNGTLQVPAVVRSGATIISALVDYISRSTTIATVAGDGTITGRVGGQTWIVASTAVNGGARDSLFLNVTRTTGPLLRTDATRVTYERNSAFSINVYLDTRGATIGAADAIFTWPTNLGTPGLIRLNNTTAGPVGSPVITSDAASGTSRISIASASGLNGVILLGRFDFTALAPGTSQLVLRLADILDLQQQSLLGISSALQYPVVVR